VTDDGGHPVLTREEVVHEFFSYMFPDTFQLALPVLRHKVGPAERAFAAINQQTYVAPLHHVFTSAFRMLC
jgi:hypothetical protein